MVYTSVIHRTVYLRDIMDIKALRSLRPVFYPRMASVLLNINKEFTKYSIVFY